jgi:hypothetical protein
VNETVLQNALAKAEAAFAQADHQARESNDARERASVWQELADTYDKTLDWWPRQEPGFTRLVILRDWAHQLSDVDA